MAHHIENENNLTNNVAIITGKGNSVQANNIYVTGTKIKNVKQNTPAPLAQRLPDLWNVPPKSENFTGRSELLKQLKHLYDQKNSTAILTACHGLGGIGKTQVALEYVWRYYKNYNGVVWFDAESQQRLQDSYICLGRELNIIHDDENKDSEELARKLKLWLEDNSRTGWLLVYDNAPNYESIRALLPVKEGNILATSRYSVGWPQQSISVDLFTIEDSRDCVKKILRGMLLEGDVTLTDKLAELLGRLPLALAQASAFVKMINITISRYLELYEERKQDLLSNKKSNLSDELLMKLDEKSQFTSVYITWDITMASIHKKSLLATNILNTCACLASDDIPYFLLKSFAGTPKNNSTGDFRICTSNTEQLFDDYSQ